MLDIRESLVLTAKAKAANVTIYDIATLPDDYSHSADGGWSEPLHYVNMPSACRFRFARQLKRASGMEWRIQANAAAADASQFRFIPACTQEGCVVTAIYNYTGECARCTWT